MGHCLQCPKHRRLANLYGIYVAVEYYKAVNKNEDYVPIWKHLAIANWEKNESGAEDCMQCATTWGERRYICVN